MANPPLSSFGSLRNVRRAGQVLRQAQSTQGQMPSLEEVRKAREVVDAFRSAHAKPLHAAYMGLRSCLFTEGFKPDVSQRLKRLPTIEDKLRRIPEMNLATMQDIGGCRAILDTQDQVQRVVKRFSGNSLRRNHEVDRVRDYVASPQPSGYRAIHIYTKYHGRRIEVQVRTRDQHSWAKIVDDLSSKTGIDYKNGHGPDKVHELLRELSALLSMREPGQPYLEDLMGTLTRLAMMAAFGQMIRGKD